MILLSLVLALAQQDDDAINLAKKFSPGDVDVYELRVSPMGKTAPLGNPVTIRVVAAKGERLSAVGAASHYEKSMALALWTSSKSGFPKSVSSLAKGFEFLPYAFVANDSNLLPGQMESICGGSVKMLSDKDSVAQIRVWVPAGKQFFISEDSDVEVASRLLSRAVGTLYREDGGHLAPLRAFKLERVRTKPVNPIPQDDEP